jgi:hypothetical protein
MRTAALERALFTSAGGALGRICRNTGKLGVQEDTHWQLAAGVVSNHQMACTRMFTIYKCVSNWQAADTGRRLGASDAPVL